MESRIACLSEPRPLSLQISDLVSRAHKQLVGRGPASVRTRIDEDLIFCLVDGGFTRLEQTLWDHAGGSPVIEYNPQEALRTLHSLGWLDTDHDGILDKNHKPLKIEMLVVTGSSASTQFAPLFQAELKKIGVQLDIVPLEFATFTQRVLAGNYQCGYLNWNLDPDPDPFSLFHSSQVPPKGQNFVFYSNPEADKLMEDARREFDQAKRAVIYRRLHAILADDQPYTWTVEVSSKWAINKRLRDVKEGKGWGLFMWFPGELGWWIPRDQRTHDVAPKRR